VCTLCAPTRRAQENSPFSCACHKLSVCEFRPFTFTAVLRAAGGEEAAQLGLQAQGALPFPVLVLAALLDLCVVPHLHGMWADTFCNVQANVRNYYMQFEEAQTQSLIDDKIMQFVQHARPAMPLVRS